MHPAIFAGLESRSLGARFEYHVSHPYRSTLSRVEQKLVQLLEDRRQPTMQIVPSDQLFTMMALRLLSILEICMWLARQKDASSNTAIIFLSHYLQSQVQYVDNFRHGYGEVDKAVEYLRCKHNDMLFLPDLLNVMSNGRIVCSYTLEDPVLLRHFRDLPPTVHLHPAAITRLDEFDQDVLDLAELATKLPLRKELVFLPQIRTLVKPLQTRSAKHDYLSLFVDTFSLGFGLSFGCSSFCKNFPGGIR